MNKKYNCKICKDERWIEVDPIRPEQVIVPKYEPCECLIKETEDGEIDDTIDDDINYV